MSESYFLGYGVLQSAADNDARRRHGKKKLTEFWLLTSESPFSLLAQNKGPVYALTLTELSPAALRSTFESVVCSASLFFLRHFR
jgi:hypothetical protein